MRVLGFGTYDVTRQPRAGILLEGLRERGHDVVELNVPLGFSTAERVEVLAKPWLAYRLALRLLRCWLRLALRSRKLGRSGRDRLDAVVVGYLGHFDVALARTLFPRKTIVLDLLVFGADTARDRRAGGAVKVGLLDWLDRFAVRCADLVVVDTDEHLAMLRPSDRHKGVVVPVGAAAEWFAGQPDEPADGPLRVVFFGLYTPLQGAPTIGAAIGQLAGDTDIEFTMIGSGQDSAATRAAAAGNERVTWHDWVGATELPALVATHDVCLGIFGTTPKALRVVPNKVFQGAAAGCALVTSDTAPQRRMLGDAATFTPAGDPQALADALRRLEKDRDALAALRARAREVARDSFTAGRIATSLATRLEVDPGVKPRLATKPPAVPLTPMATLRWDLVRRILDDLAPSRVLEVGCGQGSMGARIAARTSYLGVEPDLSSYEVARQRIEPWGGTVLNDTIDAIPGTERFDLVCAFEVAEHLEDDVAALADWSRFLSPGGHLLLSVPAWQERYSTMDAMVGHYRRYSPDGLSAALRKAGATDVRVLLYGWPLGYALESARNAIARRRDGSAAESPATSKDMATRSAASGRTLQPKRIAGVAVRAGTAPFVRIQRLRPGTGVGLVALATFG